MTDSERTQKVAELQKLFPNHGNEFKPSFQDVYGKQVAYVRFVTSFSVRPLKRDHVVSALEELKTLLQELIDDVPEEVSKDV